jgi:hypothetical protein
MALGIADSVILKGPKTAKTDTLGVADAARRFNADPTTKAAGSAQSKHEPSIPNAIQLQIVGSSIVLSVWARKWCVKMTNRKVYSAR